MMLYEDTIDIDKIHGYSESRADIACSGVDGNHVIST